MIGRGYMGPTRVLLLHPQEFKNSLVTDTSVTSGNVLSLIAGVFVKHWFYQERKGTIELLEGGKFDNLTLKVFLISFLYLSII